jgi:tungstate transport system permease protein
VTLAFFWEGFREAGALLLGGDPDTWHAIVLSLWTSVLAVGVGAAAGAPLGAWVGLFRPRGHRLWAFAFRVGMAVPTVVIGLLLYGLISRRGALGGLGIIHTPTAIVIGEAALAFPIVASLTHAAAAGLPSAVAETVRTHGGSRALALRMSLSETRPTVVAALLGAFGRCVTELGIVLAVGGAIRFHTRTLPAQVSLETSRGEFGRGLAAGLILVLLACGAAVVAMALGREERR